MPHPSHFFPVSQDKKERQFVCVFIPKTAEYTVPDTH